MAQTNWIDPLGGGYHLTSNWSPANVPNTGLESADFNLSNTYNVSFFAGDNVTINDLSVLDGDVTFVSSGTATYNTSTVQIAGGDLTLFESAAFGRVNLIAKTIGVHAGSTLTFDGGSQSTTLSLQVGHFANNTNGTVELLNGSTLDVTGGSTLNVGVSNVGTSSILVDGAGSTWTNVDSLTIGDTGSGTLEVQNEGTVSGSTGNIGDNMGSTGMVTVDGVGSTWTNTGSVFVGKSGDGTLNIQNGGTVSSFNGFIANTVNPIGPLSLGIVNVDGTGGLSTWTINSGMFVGQNGNGTLNIENGGSVSFAQGFIGNVAGSIGMATVDGANSTLSSLFESLTIGNAGNGTLLIQNGGAVSNTEGFIGDDANSTGTVTVDGDDGMGNSSNWTNSNDLTVGNFGDGELNIENGGTVSNVEGIIARDSDSTSTATVDGMDSTWTNTGQLFVGFSGDGTLSILNGGSVSNTLAAIATAFGSTSTVTVDGENSTWTTLDLYVGNVGDGTLNILNGGSVASSNTNDGIGWSEDAIGTATVDGTDPSGNPSTWTNTGDRIVGLQGDGTLNIQNGGVVSNASGIIADGDTSVGTVTVDGDDGLGNPSTWMNSGGLTVGRAGSGTLNIQNGGVVSNTFGIIGEATGPTSPTGTVTVDGVDSLGNPSTWTNSSLLRVGFAGSGTLNIQNGGVVSNLHSSIGNELNSVGAVTVSGGDGLGNPSTWTNNGNMAVGSDGSGTLLIQSGGAVSNFGGSIGAGSLSTSTVTVDGDDGLGNPSTWTNSSNLTVAFEGSGTLNVQNGGVVSNGHGYVGYAAGSTGTVTVDGTGSTWTNTGLLYVGGSTLLAGGTGSLFVQDNGLVEVSFGLKIWGPGTVNLDGGSIVIGWLDTLDGGTFNFLAGSLTINSGFEVGGMAFAQNLTLGTHQTLITPATTTIAANRTLILDGGTLRTNDLTINGALQFNSGTLELTGGTVTGLAMFTVPTNGTLRATGVYALPVTAVAGSTIIATGNLTLGDAAVANGFGSAGTLAVGANTVTLQDANEVVFDSLAYVTLGQASTPGTLGAVNGLTLDFGGNITGFGTVSTPNNAATPLINNGNITGNSLAEPITLAGYVKGVGTLDNVIITGTDAPGFSPATVTRGSVAYSGILEIELGGTSPGSGYDQLNHILGNGIADLGGTLDVLLIDGFDPSLGDSFEILTAVGGVNGTFASTLFPDLDDSLMFELNYGTLGVTLEVILAGDFDGDNDVDGNDFLVWQRGGSNNPLSTEDLAAWQANLGTSATLAAASMAVPEPATLGMLLLGLAATLASRRRNRRRRS